MRGKLLLNVRLLSSKRITPACAGKTYQERFSVHHCKDHPRVCGENGLKNKIKLLTKGSPPRVRGKRQSRRCCGRSARITPACAGKTENMRTCVRLFEDHPRVCGENLSNVSKRLVSKGSPPRVRGKQFIGTLGIAPTRITPACAGKTVGESFTD